MDDIKGLAQVLEFVKHLGTGLESTGASVTTFSGKLYNVDGSTPDPIPSGGSWKQLLINLLSLSASAQHCYVTAPLPGSGTSHPDFSVGGHMTTNSSGSVPTGGKCYLMPLCYWHNGKANDSVPFSHTNTKIVQLTGYMKGELEATFMLRMPSSEPYAVLYYADDGWNFKNLSEAEGVDLRANVFDRLDGKPKVEHYVLVKRVQEKNQTMHYLSSSLLPNA